MRQYKYNRHLNCTNSLASSKRENRILPMNFLDKLVMIKLFWSFCYNVLAISWGIDARTEQDFHLNESQWWHTKSIPNMTFWLNWALKIGGSLSSRLVLVWSKWVTFESSWISDFLVNGWIYGQLNMSRRCSFVWMHYKWTLNEYGKE